MKKRLILQVNGPDRKGLFNKFCSLIYDQNINILDVSQSVLRGFLAITWLLDNTQAVVNKDRFELLTKKLARELGIEAKIYDYQAGSRSRIRDLYIFTSMGPDRPGILARQSTILADHNANIDTIKITTRENWIYTQLTIDLGLVKDIELLRNELRKECQALDLSMSLQHESIYARDKKLIVFDMDSTLVTGETIVEIANQLNIYEEMHKLTEQAMSSDEDFSTNFKTRAKLLKGVKLSQLEQIANQLEITPGAEELIQTLKDMDWKIALISSGFSIFTDVIKEKLALDFSFGNTLEIIDDVATGNVVGSIIDGEGKWRIIEELIANLGIKRDEVVTVGDGSNDRVMLRNSGLGIGLDSKEIASVVSDGRVRKEDVQMILLLLGLSQTHLDQILSAKENASQA